VKPLDVPNYLELSTSPAWRSVTSSGSRTSATVLPEGAEFDIEPERTVVTINAPISEEELEALEEGAGIEAEEPELVGEEAERADDDAADDEA
jgi:large subunit ribosomal protein L25